MRCPCSHWYLICGASYTCHFFDTTVATGAEGGTLGTGVAVHLPINFHSLSEWKEKNTENYLQHKPNMMGCGSMQISCMEHDSFKWQRQNSNTDGYLKMYLLVKQKAWEC